MTDSYPWLSFTNGTADQQALFEQALDRATYPWNGRGQPDVEVTFTPDPTLAGDVHDFAYTTVFDTPRNPCDRPLVATMHVQSNLEEERPGDQFSGVAFFQETVVHEMGHVVASWLNVAQMTIISSLFGGTYEANWRPDTDWPTRIVEAQAEFFKDVFMPKEFRRYDNRTNWKMTRGNFSAWVDIMNSLCPCDMIMAT